MVRVYQETFSKGNQCFLRAETTINNRSVAQELASREKIYKEENVAYRISLCDDNFVVLVASEDEFITVVTISDLEVK